MTALPEVLGMVSAAQFRQAMAYLATGVTVVTCAGTGDGPAGTTVSAISSLSLDPPLVLVCLDRASLTLQAIRCRGAFTVNVLAARQRHLAANFARRGSMATWHGVRHSADAAGGPQLEGVLAILECVVERRFPGGDHEIIVGRVTRTETNPDGEAGGNGAAPLLYWRGGYAALTPLPRT